MQRWIEPVGISTHNCLGANDLERARIFYGAVMALHGVRNQGGFLDQGISYGRTLPELLILKPLDREKTMAANGAPLGFQATDRAVVDAFHTAGLARGRATRPPMLCRLSARFPQEQDPRLLFQASEHLRCGIDMDARRVGAHRLLGDEADGTGDIVRVERGD